MRLKRYLNHSDTASRFHRPRFHVSQHGESQALHYYIRTSSPQLALLGFPAPHDDHTLSHYTQTLPQYQSFSLSSRASLVQSAANVSSGQPLVARSPTGASSIRLTMG